MSEDPDRRHLLPLAQAGHGQQGAVSVAALRIILPRLLAEGYQFQTP
jgi:hypothetical protein